MWEGYWGRRLRLKAGRMNVSHWCANEVYALLLTAPNLRGSEFIREGVSTVGIVGA
ncbi:MAG: hypothetical protein JWQ69_1249 [Pseudomonas sp.]|nr:hypothetical protein [Pseudomonas sp.]